MPSKWCIKPHDQTFTFGAVLHGEGFYIQGTAPHEFRLEAFDLYYDGVYVSGCVLPSGILYEEGEPVDLIYKIAIVSETKRYSVADVLAASLKQASQRDCYFTHGVTVNGEPMETGVRGSGFNGVMDGVTHALERAIRRSRTL